MSILLFNYSVIITDKFIKIMFQINIDYIGVVKTTLDGHVLFTNEPIKNDYQNLLSKLKAMVSNSNMTVLNMQNLFNSELRGTPKYINYCYPYHYCSRDIEGAKFPFSYTYHEYQKKISSSNNKDMLSINLKKDYEKAAIRYIQALCYYRTLNELKFDNNNKVFSTENIGWTQYEYNINSDIKFKLSTNFGYGNSAYFFVNLTYKGIDILPYSMMVCYYYANMIDFVRYTRMYAAQRNSWNIALNFIAKTANEAIVDPSDFIRNWIINELKMMIVGLQRFAENPSYAFYELLKPKNTENFVAIRNINGSEEKDYNIYPSEIMIAKQAEKITGALSFLTNLQSLSEIFPQVSHYIQMIKDLNLKLLPSFIRKIEVINKEVVKSQTELKHLEAEFKTLYQYCEPHDAIILMIKNEKELKSDKCVSMEKIRNEYCMEHLDYKINFEKMNQINLDIEKRNSDIWNRKRFISELKSYVDKIRETLHLSA